MIDNVSILFSTVLVVFVVVRAVMLDRRLPWFGPDAPGRGGAGGKRARPPT